MKILHLCTHINTGGITQYIYTLSQQMIKRENEVHIFSSGGEFEERFREMGAFPHTFSIRTKSELSPKVYLAIPRVIRFIKKNKIDILHAHTRVTQVLSFYVSLLTGIPYVTTCHGFFKRRLGRRLLPAWGNRVIAISDPVQMDLEETFKEKPEKIRVIYNGVDIEALENCAKSVNLTKVKEDFQLSDGKPIIGIVSRIIQAKGFDYLARALKILISKYPKIKLMIVGKGDYEERLKKLILELEIQSHVIFLGTQRNVVACYAAMDIFVLPSIWREGFGLVVSEAMALRKPIVVSNTGALNRLINDGSSGLLAKPRNVKDLAEKLDYLICHPDEAKQMGQNAYQHAKNNFSVEQMAIGIQKVYEECL